MCFPGSREFRGGPRGEPEATEKEPHSNAGSWGWDPWAEQSEQSGEIGGRVAAGDGWDWAGRTSRGSTGWALVPRGGLRKGPEEGALAPPGPLLPDRQRGGRRLWGPWREGQRTHIEGWGPGDPRDRGLGVAGPEEGPGEPGSAQP